jgi:AcrR family transcriptional regulator
MREQKNSTSPRPYRMSRRQAAVEETRERIAAATFELHATIGPSKTTIKAIAERAGVQRHTVYHHFPDLTRLFQACTAHGMRVTRFPDPARWRAIEDPRDRLRAGLSELYPYYRANERLVGNVLRDMPLFEDVGGVEQFEDAMADILRTLTDGWDLDSRGPAAAPVRTAVSHAMAFETWRSLTQHGMTDDQARDMMVSFVSGIADQVRGASAA